METWLKVEVQIAMKIISHLSEESGITARRDNKWDIVIYIGISGLKLDVPAHLIRTGSKASFKLASDVELFMCRT